MPGLPTLTTQRLVLRPMTPDDAPIIAACCQDGELQRFTSLIPSPYELHHAETWIRSHTESYERGENVQLAVVERTRGDLVGCVGLRLEPQNARGELGYWIAAAHRNRGYATEAARAMVRYAFEVRCIRRVWAYHYAENEASGRVLERAGMVREGVCRDYVMKWGRWVDCPLYAITRGDYEALVRGGSSAGQESTR